jgi:hypothetical protein
MAEGEFIMDWWGWQHPNHRSNLAWEKSGKPKYSKPPIGKNKKYTLPLCSSLGKIGCEFNPTLILSSFFFQ